MTCFFKCMLTFDKITWHQLVTRRPRARLFTLLQSCFLTINDLLSALNETQLMQAFEEKLCHFTVLRDASVKTPCPGAKVKLSWHSVSGCVGQRTFCMGGSSLRIFTHTFLYNKCPFSLWTHLPQARHERRWGQNLQLEKYQASDVDVKMPWVLFVDLVTKIFI